MLTRLKIRGFKNLLDVDVRFGPFTCIAGANGVGKSNLFDAIRFLSHLTDHTLVDAARHIRDDSKKSGTIQDLFFRAGDYSSNSMYFEADLLVPPEGVDDYGKPAKATTTSLRYKLELGYRELEEDTSGSLEILFEELHHIKKSDTPKTIGFKSGKTWQQTAIQGARYSKSPLISTTVENNGDRIVRRHQDRNPGRPEPYLANKLPKTVLSSVQADAPTACLARKEMASWRLLQLEPSSLRRPDDFDDVRYLEANGSHLASTLFRLSGGNSEKKTGKNGKSRVYADVRNRLLELIGDVQSISVDRDEKRRLITLLLQDEKGTQFPAKSLSDGTLRFLALAVLEADPEAHGVICLEEPENGIHPKRIPAMIDLLQDVAMDVNEPLGPDNPARQVIINTHSPLVVSVVPDDSILVAELKETISNTHRLKTASFSFLSDTWRSRIEPNTKTVNKGNLIDYLSATIKPEPKRIPRRIGDREDMRQYKLIPEVFISGNKS